MKPIFSPKNNPRVIIIQILYGKYYNNDQKIIIKEYLNASNYFIEDAKTKYLNALLDKISKNLRLTNE